nr:hypothetical protein Iba_chr01aCG4520 [Ipomoea batatas]
MSFHIPLLLRHGSLNTHVTGRPSSGVTLSRSSQQRPAKDPGEQRATSFPCSGQWLSFSDATFLLHRQSNIRRRQLVSRRSSDGEGGGAFSPLSAVSSEQLGGSPRPFPNSIARVADARAFSPPGVSLSSKCVDYIEVWAPVARGSGAPRQLCYPPPFPSVRPAAATVAVELAQRHTGDGAQTATSPVSMKFGHLSPRWPSSVKQSARQRTASTAHQRRAFLRQA